MTTNIDKHTGLTVQLRDGNAFAILGACQRVLKRNDLADVWDEFHAEATAGDYNHLLRTVMEYFDVDLDD